MKQITLYTGGGVSLSPVYVEGRTESDYVRLVADDGMMLEKGNITTLCVDVPKTDAPKWSEVPYVEPVPEPTADEALTRYANELTGENDPDLVSATETLIKHFTEE